jgi:hypothetical protein
MYTSYRNKREVYIPEGLAYGPVQATEDFDAGVAEAINDRLSRGEGVKDLLKLGKYINRHHRHFSFARALMRNGSDLMVRESMNTYNETDHEMLVGILADYIFEADDNAPQRLVSTIEMVMDTITGSLENFYVTYTYSIYNEDSRQLTKILHPLLDWDEVERIAIAEWGTDDDFVRFIVRAADMIDV